MSNPSPGYTPSQGYQTQYGAGYTQTYPSAPHDSQQIPVTSEHVALIRQKESFIMQIILSCAVIWLCFLPLGLAAFILAIIAYNKAQLPDNQSAAEAHKLGVYSTGLSIAGIIVGIILIIVLVIINVTAGSPQ